jgi:hypothetical protein
MKESKPRVPIPEQMKEHDSPSKCSVHILKKVCSADRSPRGHLLAGAMDVAAELLQSGPVDEIRLYHELHGTHFRKRLCYSALLNYHRCYSDRTKLFLNDGIWTLVSITSGCSP